MVMREECRELWAPLAASRSTSWKFAIQAHGRTLPLPLQREIIEDFAYMDFLGGKLVSA